MAEEENMAEQLSPAEVFSPGEFLSEELEARGWSQQEFAEIIGRPANAVSEIINGKRAITPGMAKALAAALGTSPTLWMNLDAAYRLEQEDPAPGRIQIQARLRSKYPVRDMIQRGCVEGSDDPEVLEHRVLRFFGVESLDDTPQFRMAARKGIKGWLDAEDSPKQLASLFRVRQCAGAMQIGKYSESKLRQALPRLEALMSEPEEVRHAPKLLEACGVRFVIVEPLPGSKIDGVCFWLDPWRPVVALTLRFDRIDNFWFVLRHELEHVLRQDAAIDEEVGQTAEALTEQEEVANLAAGSFGVTQEEMEDFVQRVQSAFSDKRVVGFALKHGVHPGIVVGRLQYRLGRYTILKKYLVNIREYAVGAAMTDGYGKFCPVNSKYEPRQTEVR